MRKFTMSRRRAVSISNGFFLVALAFFILTGLWWPWIIAGVGGTIALRQYLTGSVWLSAVTVIISGLIIITQFFRFDWSAYLAALLIVAGIFIIVREGFFSGDTNGEDKAEEIKEDADIRN